MFIDLNLVTAFHRVAKYHARGDTVRGQELQELVAQVHSRVPFLAPHHLTNTVWAMAKLGMLDMPLLDSIASASIALIAD